MTSLPPLGAGEIAGPMIGLFLIALGTGGIKPCVSAFGGDQFTSDQSHLLQSFFSVFYFAINAGSLLSMLITPVLRGRNTKKREKAKFLHLHPDSFQCMPSVNKFSFQFQIHCVRYYRMEVFSASLPLLN